MKNDRWMPLHIGDYLADTIGLTDEQHGRYLLSIMAYWRNHGPLTPTEMKAIMKADFASLVRFYQLSQGRYRHHRIDLELKLADDHVERNKARTEAATLARKKRHDERDDNVTTHVTFTPLPLPLPSDKDLKGKPTKAKKLSESRRQLAGAFEAALNSGWTNDAGKWVNRIKEDFNKCLRVAAELQNAIKEGRVNSTPAAYAEHIWKEFA